DVAGHPIRIFNDPAGLGNEICRGLDPTFWHHLHQTAQAHRNPSYNGFPDQGDRGPTGYLKVQEHRSSYHSALYFDHGRRHNDRSTDREHLETWQWHLPRDRGPAHPDLRLRGGSYLQTRGGHHPAREWTPETLGGHGPRQRHQRHGGQCPDAAGDRIHHLSWDIYDPCRRETG